MSYDGNIAEMPLGLGGLDASENLSSVDITRLIKAFNVEITDRMIKKEGGTTNVNSTAISGGPAIVGGCDFWPTTGTQVLVIATSDGKIYKSTDGGATLTAIKTGLGSDKKTVFCEGGSEEAGNEKKLFIFNGNDPVQVLKASDLTQTTDITTPAADWATAQPVKGCVHNGRLWVIKGHFLYGSMITDHEDFTTAGSQLFQVYSGEGSYLTNMVSIFGRLYLFKYPTGIYYLDDSDNDSTYWGVRKVTGKIGCAGVDALDYGKNEVAYMSADGGIHYLSGTDQFGDVKDSDFAALLNIDKYLKENTRRNRLDRAVLRYNEDKKTLYAVYTKSASSRNDLIVKINFEDIQVPKASITTKDDCESIWLAVDSTSKITKTQLGSSNGFIADDNQSNENVNGVAYTGHFQLPHTDLTWLDSSLGAKNKQFDFLELHFNPLPDTAYNLTCVVYIDGAYYQTLTFNMATDAATLDSFVLDTDQLYSGVVQVKRLPLYGYGRRISLEFYNSGLNQGFEVFKAYLSFRVGDEGVIK